MVGWTSNCQFAKEKRVIRKLGVSGEKEGDLQFDAVDEDDSGIITAVDTVKTIIKDPLFAILEENSSITHPSG